MIRLERKAKFFLSNQRQHAIHGREWSHRENCLIRRLKTIISTPEESYRILMLKNLFDFFSTGAVTLIAGTSWPEIHKFLPQSFELGEIDINTRIILGNCGQFSTKLINSYSSILLNSCSHISPNFLRCQSIKDVPNFSYR